MVSQREHVDIITVSTGGPPNADIAIAGSRAGAIGVLDLQFGTDDDRATGALSRLGELGRGRRGILIDASTTAVTTPDGRYARLVEAATPGIDHVLLAGAAADQIDEALTPWRERGLRTFVVVTEVDQARAAATAGADAVIAKGHEAGGWVGEESAFVLLQRCLAAVTVPVWVQGGIGLHTAAAAAAAGAAGVVLDSQLLLTRESPIAPALQARIRTLDGSETVCLGAELGTRLRVLGGPGPGGISAAAELEAAIVDGEAGPDEQQRAWREGISRLVDSGPEATIARSSDSGPGPPALVAIGQDAALAADLAARFRTVSGVVRAVTNAVGDHLTVARAHQSTLAPGGALARAHGTTYGIVQGPMTRVSDRSRFAASVAEAGALPLLALALMRGAESQALLEETATLLGDRPWGVGILGFAPADLRAEQMEAIRATRPPFALIAGGRPDHARSLEAEGIATYLHVPSPALLRLYLQDGATRFVFEGRECGGHVGPLSSFVLWDTMIRVLDDELPAGADPSEYSVLFAGGIHDARSAAMVVAAAAPLAAKGVRIGVLAGTAYLFTAESVESGAITETFQQAALAGERTVLLESGPGHATRCLPSPFVDEFVNEGRRLRQEGVAAHERRLLLENLNLGRLRIASKGLERGDGADGEGHQLVEVGPEGQWSRGMFMIGQVATMHDRVRTLAELHADIGDGSAALLADLPARAPRVESAPSPAAVAIVGMSCILPGAPDLEQFWANILNKVDAITEVPATRWDWKAYFDADRTAHDKVYSRWGGFIDDVVFDPLAFGMPPSTLRSIEPFQLLGLVTAHAALADAGYDRRPFERDRTSVILGAGGGGADLAVGYTVRAALPHLFGDGAPRISEALGDRLPEWTEDSFPGLLMNVAAGRIANRLDLGGTNYTVDAACGSSLAAIGLAVRELQTGTSEMVIAGGVDAIQNPFGFLCFSKTFALSPSGRCRPFDASADGIAISEGFATVVLKRLDDAERDGDRIYATIRGVGSASDGRDRSLTAPRPEGQMRALRRAYAHAQISPSTVSLVEAHGTGTVAGDSAEIESLSTVLDEAGADRQSCAVGSVKSMIGHTKATAGVAGLVKAALALHHKVLPPTLGVTTPNPRADFPASALYVNSEPRPWIHGGDEHPRRAGVSAFGFGGTNFHTVLEEYTGGYLADAAPLEHWAAELLVWRGATPADVRTAVSALQDQLDGGAQPVLADLAFTVTTPAVSAAGPVTLAIVAESVAGLRDQLATALTLLDGAPEHRHGADGVHLSRAPLTADGGVAFLFPGQGSQHVDMARELAILFPEVRGAFDEADRVLAGRYPRALSRSIFPPPAFTRDERDAQLAALTLTHVAQAALGATELGYLRLLGALGVEADMVAGHSYGELVALTAAGCLAPDDLLRLSEERGRFIQEGAGEDSGAMAAIKARPEQLTELLEDPDLVIANVNSPTQLVVSGSRATIERAVLWCRDHDLGATVLPVSCGFHSSYVAGAQQRLAAALAEVPLAPPRVAVFSNTTGDRYPDDPAAIGERLGRHLVEPVQFQQEIEAMHDAGARLFVEVGPRNVLTGLVGRTLADRPHIAVPVDQQGRSGIVALLSCLATLATEGVALDPDVLFRGRGARRVDLARLAATTAPAAPAPSTWLVNGGRARPAAQALEVIRPLDPGDLMNPEQNHQDHATAAPSNGHHHDVMVESAAPMAPAVATPVAEVFGAIGEGGGDLDSVMAQYHEVMQRFLGTEEAVMLAYLGQPPRATSARLIAPARRTLPSPAAPAALSPVGPNGHTTPAAPPQAAPPPAAPPPATAPAATPPPAPASAVSPAPAATGPTISVQDQLLEIVGERTGYPLEMLDLDADLEADLGIDSIKRVEIVGTMIQALDLPDSTEIDRDELTTARTLRGAIALLEALATTGKPEVAASHVPF